MCRAFHGLARRLHQAVGFSGAVRILLDKFFAACDEEERLLFEFFLQTGMREQEVIYATDRCLDFANCTVSVKHNPAHNWTPKMYKERTVPVPKALMSKLKQMLVKRGKGGLLFPTKSGLPKWLDLHDGYDLAVNLHPLLTQAQRHPTAIISVYPPRHELALHQLVDGATDAHLVHCRQFGQRLG